MTFTVVITVNGVVVITVNGGIEASPTGFVNDIVPAARSEDVACMPFCVPACNAALKTSTFVNLGGLSHVATRGLNAQAESIAITRITSTATQTVFIDSL